MTEEFVLQETEDLVLDDSKIRAGQVAVGLKPPDEGLEENKTTKQDDDPDKLNHPGEPDAAQKKIESLAAKTGWKPEDKFNGKKEEWTDAETWLLKGIDIQRESKENFKSLAENNKMLRKTMEDLKRINETVYQSKLRDLEGQLSEAKANRKAAITDADVDLVETIDKNISDLTTEIVQNKNKIQEVSAPDPGETDPSFTDWKEKNTWYQTDAGMTKFADSIAAEYDGKLPLDRLLLIVDKKVQEVWPEKFEQRENIPDLQLTRDKVNPVEPGSRRLSAKTTKITVNDLSPQEKDSMRRFVKTGTLTQEQYLKVMQDYRAA